MEPRLFCLLAGTVHSTAVHPQARDGPNVWPSVGFRALGADILECHFSQVLGFMLVNESPRVTEEEPAVASHDRLKGRFVPVPRRPCGKAASVSATPPGIFAGLASRPTKRFVSAVRPRLSVRCQGLVTGAPLGNRRPRTTLARSTRIGPGITA